MPLYTIGWAKVTDNCVVGQSLCLHAYMCVWTWVRACTCVYIRMRVLLQPRGCGQYDLERANAHTHANTPSQA